MIREPIFQALYDLGSTVTWDGGRTFKTRSRRVQHFSKVAEQPAFFQVEPNEMPQQVTGMPYKWELDASWLIYQNVGKDPKAIPATENNLIMDALENAMGVQFLAGVQFTDRCTLGGLVYNVKISGTVMKYDGALEGQGIIAVPLKILVP